MARAAEVYEQDPHSNRAEMILDAFLGTQRPIELLNLRQFERTKRPERVLWKAREKGEEKIGGAIPNAVLHEGDIMLLSGAGKGGKSFLTIAIAEAAARRISEEERGVPTPAWEEPDEPVQVERETCGLGVRAGPVVIVAYEDKPYWLVERTKALPGAKNEIPENLHIWPMPGPLFVPEGRGSAGTFKRTGEWNPLWKAIRRIKPSLVILDPGTYAVDGIGTSDAGPIRRFMRELSAEAEIAKAGIILVVHDTKAHRKKPDHEEPDAEAVAGSAAWQDSARGILHLARRTDPEAKEKGCRILRCFKASYAKDGWKVNLKEVPDYA